MVLVGVLDDAEHAPCLFVVRRQRGLPVLQLRPLPVFEECPRRDVQRVRVAEASAPDTAPRDHGDVPEGGHAEDPLHAQHRVVEVTAQIARRARELRVAKALSVRQHPDAVAFLGQAQRAHAAAEARAYDQPVEVVLECRIPHGRAAARLSPPGMMLAAGWLLGQTRTTAATRR